MKRIFLPIAAFALLSACSLSFSINIFDAIKAVNINKVRELIEVENVNVNITNTSGHTPLNLACVCNELEIVRLLLPNCTYATVNIADNYGQTPLRRALIHRNPEIIKLLLANGANFNPDSIGHYQRNPEILRLLTLAQDLDNSDNKLGFIEKQSDAEIVVMLCERLWKKHGRKYSDIKKSLDILGHERGFKNYNDCRIKTL